ncbi:MAG: CapA family protein, partial [Caldilineaceae bacterium]
WAGDVTTYTSVAVLTSTLPALEQVLGPAGPTIVGSETMSEVVEAAWSADRATLALVPFDHLVPQLAVLRIDGQTPVENAVKFSAAAYPFKAVLYAHTNSPSRSERTMMQAMLAALPRNNRDPGKVTTLTMTGVTAMVRFMAREMDSRGAAWPAEVVGEELASADITHISNEVPFTEECETDVRLDNYNFCTRAEYMETLRLSGVDIIGLTGNHQNDFGRKAALFSLDFYAKEGLPVYGGGRTVEEANRPLYVEHNGNRIAFLGANSYGPEMAWADAGWPGSARFDLAILSATIREIKQKNLADLVLVELQYQESYETTPLIDQRNDFNALIRAGADIVTGVQSHVPQGMEFTEGRLILYGLGNLYFDQMNSMPTRENLVVKHTLYDGRHISTQVETTLLHDFGQPRWMTPEQREALLNRVFANSYWQY